MSWAQGPTRPSIHPLFLHFGYSPENRDGQFIFMGAGAPQAHALLLANWGTISPARPLGRHTCIDSKKIEKGLAKEASRGDTQFRKNQCVAERSISMPYDTPSAEAVSKELTQWVNSLNEPKRQPHKRGRPSSLPGWQVSLAVLLSLWQGLCSQLDVWRLIAFFGVGPFAPLAVSDQTVYNYLEQTGVQGFQQCFAA